MERESSLDVDLIITSGSPNDVGKKTITNIARVLFVNATTHSDTEKIAGEGEDLEVLFVNTNNPYLLGVLLHEHA